MRTPLYKSRPVEPNPAKFGGQRINEFIVMSEGYSNSYLLQTSQGNIQINAGIFFEGPVHKQNYDAFTQDPVRYLVLTQGHVDHVGGVAWTREQNPGMQVIAQANHDEHLGYDARLAPFRANRSAFAFEDKMARAFAYYQEHGYTDYPGMDPPLPDITFTDRYQFTLGELEVELIAVPGAETNDSLVVWLPQHRICLTGNLFGCPFGHFPNLVTIRGDRYRDALTCAAAAQTVLDLGAQMILYGHHQPVIGADVIRNELTAYRDAIHYVHDAVVQGMNAGKDVHTLMAEITLPSELEVGQGYGKVAWSVRAIWENYAGWFKHSSTTELYPEPRSAVNADLLELAGGTQPLVDRALKKLETGEITQALHLLDIVLASESVPAAAIEAALEAHRRLLADSVNFWLTAWLNSQIKSLQSRLDK